MEKVQPSQTIIIRPIGRSMNFDLRELFHYRHLLFDMVRRTFRLEFDSYSLGVFWAITRPLAMVFIFTFIKQHSGANMQVQLEYTLYLYSGLILWFYFRDATMATAKSIMKDSGIMKRIYYPRLITPIVPGLAKLYSLGICTIPLIFMIVYYNEYPCWRLVILPAVLLQCVMLILGTGLVFSSLILIKSDFERFLNLCLYLGLFVSPVIFSPDMIPHRGRIIYFLNPMAGTLLAFRSCFFKNFPFPMWQFIYSVIFTIIALFVGLIVYRRAEVYFADKI